MSKILKVSSLPLKDVIIDLSHEFKTDYTEKCTEYMLTVPEKWGSGEIRGIDFDNGLGIIIYQCRFDTDIQIRFTVDDVHPVKYIYTTTGPVSHSFSNENTIHHINEHTCAIVASKDHNGHVLYFNAEQQVNVVSLEIDREKFFRNTECAMDNLSAPLQELFNDFRAKKKFYHQGFFGVNFYAILDSIDSYEDKLLLRKLHLESQALNIFVNQIRLFEDDIKPDFHKTILRYNELKQVEKLGNLISNNIASDFSIEELSKESGLNPNKLQYGFKHVYNKTVREFIIVNRLEKAKHLLSTTDLSMNDIAGSIGIKSSSYFSKLFKNHFGITPLKYKENIVR